MALGPMKTGAFSGAAQSGGFNHNHAASMAHVAAGRRQIAASLGAMQPGAGAPPPLAPPVAAIGPPLAQAPGMGPVPGMAPGPGLAPPTPAHIKTGNFKVHIAHIIKQNMGVSVTHNAVMSAIDRLAAKGQAAGGFSGFQASALKAHTGPLEGPQGAQTQSTIAKEVMQPSGPVTH